MIFLHKMYLTRFSLMAGLFLILFPVAVIWLGLARSLFGGLFDVEDFGPTFWVACSAYLLSWSATVTFHITRLYGPERVGMETSSQTGSSKSRRSAQLVFIVGMLMPLPLLVSVLSANFSWDAFAGALTGFLFVLALVYLADLIHRLFNTFQLTDDQPETNDPGKHLFFPFDNRLARMAERSTSVQEFFRRPVFRRISQLLWRLPETYTVGYVKRGENYVTVNPGMILPIVMFAAFLSLYAIGFFFWANRPNIDLGLTAITFVLILVTLLCWLFAGTAFFFDRFRLPTLLTVVTMISFSQLNHTYDVAPLPVRNTAFEHATPAQILNARSRDDYIILVAANGGGIQSSAWATEVLTRFDEHCRNVDQRPEGCRNAIAAISGVSGGSVGAMYFMESYNGDAGYDPDVASRIREYSQKSSLDFVGGTLVFQDFVRNIPFISDFTPTDRGRRLATGWEANKVSIDRSAGIIDDAGEPLDAGPHPGQRKRVDLKENLSAWREGTLDRSRPAVIFNSTVVETGHRLLFSTAKFPNRDPKTSDWLSLDDIAGDNADIGITEAVRLSSAFAYVSPAPVMSAPPALESVNDEFRRYHVVDGGYADNYGLLSLRDFLNEGLKNLSFDAEQKPKFIIIQILGEQVARDPVTGEKRRPGIGSISVFEQFLAPLSTLLNVRQTGQFARNTEAMQSIESILENRGLVARRFVFEYPSADAPLSWHLTNTNIEDIRKAGTAIGALDVSTDSPNFKNFQQWTALRAELLSQSERQPLGAK
ncbi:MAG: hypothetical protein QUS14_00820 [Pyrinomonadaceae bacterium]|nr:hypothetical protein [Pyrinomonadaceae bacterium]